jgi:hypothetical protein
MTHRVLLNFGEGFGGGGSAFKILRHSSVPSIQQAADADSGVNSPVEDREDGKLRANCSGMRTPLRTPSVPTEMEWTDKPVVLALGDLVDSNSRDRPKARSLG